MNPISLSEVISALEAQTEDSTSYLDKETGEVTVLSSEEWKAAEMDVPLENFPNWQQDLIRCAVEILDDLRGERFVQMPTQWDIHEWDIMQDFALSVRNERVSEELYYAIRGRGAFRRFKDKIHFYAIEDDWYRFRDKTLRQIAIDWCEDNDVAYRDDTDWKVHEEQQTARARERLEQQVRFLLEIDRLKGVLRRSLIIAPRRRENSAEHSWHLAMMAAVLAEHTDAPVDLLWVIKMVLVHDIVEIDAGDTYAYDAVAAQDQTEREQQAAARIFDLLPPDQAGELRGLWEEFERWETPEACFAHALDRLMPLLHNYHTGGTAWQENGVVRSQVEARIAPIQEGSTALAGLAREIVERAVREGMLPDR